MFGGSDNERGDDRCAYMLFSFRRDMTTHICLVFLLFEPTTVACYSMLLDANFVLQVRR
jgi:hypothetical protein